MGEEELSHGRGAPHAGAPPSPPLKASLSIPAVAQPPKTAPPPAAVLPKVAAFSAAAAGEDESFIRRRLETAAAERRVADDFHEREREGDTSAAAAEKKAPGRRFCRCGCPRRTFSDFMQQRLPAWQPVLSPRRILTILGVCGAVFLALGILILVCSNQILECKVNYTQETGTEVLLRENLIVLEATRLEEEFLLLVCSHAADVPGHRIGPEHCTDTNAEEITGEVYLFYELHNFYQNHRRYLKSRSDAQLQGKVYTSPGEVKAVCDPRYLSADGRVLDPCGLNAVAVFTDAYSLWREGSTGSLVPVGLDETRETICWHFDLRSRFRNPTPAERQAYADKVDFWLFEPEMRKALHMDKPGVGEGVENSHFIVWMREAALPAFRKVYGKIRESPVKLPFFVRVTGNYDVASFGGKKFVVVSQASWLGGRNSFLGITYIVVACICIVVCLMLGYAQMRNPRHMGDVSWLKKALYADG